MKTSKMQKVREVDSLELFRKLSEQEKDISFLYSGKEEEWSILAWNPCSKLIYNGTGEPPWRLIQDQLQSQYHNANYLPFTGGFIGHFAYELGYNLLGIESKKNSPVPLIHLNYYTSAVLKNHKTNTTYLVSENLESFESEINTIVQRPVTGGRLPITNLNWTPNITKEKYSQDLQKIHQDLHDGEIYQACYTYNMSSESNESGQDLFLQSVNFSPAEMSAYLQGPNYELISASPERFLSVKNKLITTCPIKGTRPRGQTGSEDQRLLQELLDSEKDKAELMMITDLLRNDLGKVSEFGTVKVQELRSTMSTPSVWHTYSKITGNLRSDCTNIDLLQATFPGGSITGCPKHRSVKILNKLESEPRGVYTGCIGYLSTNGNMDLSIAIRTVTKQGPNLTLGVGGGIVYDSDVKSEWEETIAKAKCFTFTQPAAAYR
jgi:para-aminobenzoate synthetase component I